jgi:hypothetical protein
VDDLSSSAAPRPEPRHVILMLSSLAAAGIHFGVMGQHFEESFVLGLFFAVVAWAQVLWAVALLLAPTRSILLLGGIGNLAVIGVWMVSRTAGVPLGTTPWTPEAVGGADLVATALEAVAVIACTAIVVRPARVERRAGGGLSVLTAGMAVAVLATAAIATAGHEHAHPEGSEGSSAVGLDSGGSDPLDEGHHPAGGSGEADPAQIEAVRAAMEKYQDVEVAYAEGWVAEHDDYPEIGAHFVRESDWDGSGPVRPELDVLDPEFLMYSTLLTGGEEWQLVAVAYVVDQAVYPAPPTELAGAVYHEHVWNCILDGEELEEEDWGVISREECDVMGGEWSPGGVWMTHVWLIDNPNGVFAETNPGLTALRRV